MKIIKHYTTSKGKYELKAILNENNRIDIVCITSAIEQNRYEDIIYLQGLFTFNKLVNDARVIDNINYTKKLVDLLY